MRIAIYGTGGAGGYFGARLAAAGEDVVFIARGEHLRAIREHGLRLITPVDEITIHPAAAFDDPTDVGPVDVIFFGLKTWQLADAARAAAAARENHDFLGEQAIARYPPRCAGLASVALHDPVDAGKELERAVTRLGFKGVMINGYSNVAGGTGAEYLDAPRLLPFWEAAAALGVPVYLHPRPAFDQRIYEGHSQLIGATWGFAPEAATHALRLVFSGLFDRFPSLTLVLGHLGETLPYFAWRIQHCFEFNPADKRLRRRLQDYLCDNFYVSTSGFFNDQALIGAVLTIGADRILFAVDYPYEPMDPAAAWIERAPISEIDRRKIAHLNARTLFRLPSHT